MIIYAPMKSAIKVTLAVFALCSTLSLAAEPRINKFTRYDAGEYVIVTSRSATQAKRIMEGLVRFRLTLERMLGKRAAQNAFPTTIVIASHTDWTKWLQPRENIAGYFQRAPFSNYMTFDGDASIDEALHVMFHEYTHYYLATQFAGEWPPWFNEGMAELMGWARFDKNMAYMQVPLEQVQEARDGDWIPFDRLIRVDDSDPEYQSHRLAPQFYAQSWLTLNYGFIENREFGRQVIKYVGEINRLVPQPQAATDAFGDLAAIDKLLRDYSHASTIAGGGLNLGEVPPVEMPAGKSLDDVDAMAVLADVMLETRLAPGRIRPLVESLERRDPNVARAAILAARLAQRDDDNAAFDRAVAKAEGAMAPGDWEQHRELAGVLLQSGLDTSPMSSRTSAQSDADLKRSLKWFGEAIAHNNQDIEALWGFGTTATRLDTNLELAEQALVGAYKRAPTSAEIAQSLANLKARQDKPDEMLPYLKDVMRFASNLETRRWAAETYLQTQKFITERDKVEAENKRVHEEYEKQLAEYEKKYGKRKKKNQ